LLVGFGRTEHQKLDLLSVVSDPFDLMEHNDENMGWRLLEALYEMGRADLPATPKTLATWLDVSETRIQQLLPRLDGQGLIDASQCRLSMQGLVLAVSIHGAQKLWAHSIAA